MSYLVLARKYRSRTFAELVGQEHVVKALSNALTQGRLHHAYLFTGTRGVGKTSVSRILAKSLNCIGADGQGGITAEPCGVCPACRDIDAGRFVDYIELDAASNRGVEEISLLLDQAVYKPVVGRFKVYLIDEVHMLSTTAFNAMLKTLEEPPEYLKFVLATTDPQKVPPTVLSRCLQFNLRPMAPQTVQEHLARVLADEHIEADAGALRLLSRAARGSMRDALSLTDQAIAYGAGSLTEAGVREMLGAVDRGHAVRIVEALAASDGAALVAAADALRGLGLSAAGTLEELSDLLQQMAVAQAVPEALDASDPESPTVARLAPLIEADELQLLYSMALHGCAELGLAPDEYSGLVMVLLRMLAFRPQGGAPVSMANPSAADKPRAAESPAPVRAAPLRSSPSPTATLRVTPTVRAAPAAVSVPAPIPEPARPNPGEAALTGVEPEGQRPALRSEEPPPWLDAPPDVDEGGVAVLAAPAAVIAREPAPVVPTANVAMLQPTALGERWSVLFDEMLRSASISALTRELAFQSECIEVASDGPAALWRLRVERESLRAPAQRDKLQAAMALALGAPVRLEVELGRAQDSPSLRATAERDRRQREAERIIHDDPLVKALMQQYRTARIVPGSIKPH
jgi:DNA polymerase-3 subunit gamma/tau